MYIPCIYTCIQLLLSSITDGSGRDQQNEHDRAIPDINHSEYGSANSVVSSFEMYIWIDLRLKFLPRSDRGE